MEFHLTNMHLSWLPLEQLPSVNVYNAFLLVGAAAIVSGSLLLQTFEY